jgi:hypothetical protein
MQSGRVQVRIGAAKLDAGKMKVHLGRSQKERNVFYKEPKQLYRTDEKQTCV